MLIRQHLKSELQIGKDNIQLSSDSISTPLSSSPIQNQNQNQTHFSPPFSSSSHHPPPPSSNSNPSSSSSSSPSRTPLLSSPHKRTYHHHRSPLFTIPFCSKFLTLKLLTVFRFLIFLPLPTLYFLISNPSLLDFIFVLSFSGALLISLNLALPRLPSIRLFLARSLPVKLSSSFASANSSQPVLWSIGSKSEEVKGLNSGSWVQVYGNGDVYEGEFHKGKSSGSGVYHYHMSGRYEGDWVDGEYDGYGVETWARGSRYRGQYRQGLRHGIGIYRFYGGDVYAGEWYNGQCHGFGIHTCSDGSRYAGEFKWGVKHGIGQYHFRNGDIYAGEYFADKMHGFGVYQFQNGHRYEGAWHEGRRQGLGMYTFRNGETQCGHWQNGILDDPKRQNSNTGSPCAVDHAKVLKAVQDAHCAAGKAYNLEKADERVNKVVAAANKAATAARVAAVKAVQNRIHHNNKWFQSYP
ncbi:phosphatidylinositol 4-phosphate 5-kinase 9-like [Lotus japonicus]|uniref:phosphatidylinositol 4-phosphate 5-kinase 9-like n=1 Tax=Lotus japonicus TaxID=34305 RepID=UPI002585E63D|nr:phosphatidylinositol 4-phosphate 5-kinase 9-like [Lotus japonicus]